MEVALPVINRISGLESGITSLPIPIPNPTFLSQILSSIPQVYEITFSLPLDFIKWSALILAFLATFTSLINKVKISFLVFRQNKRLLQHFDEFDDDFSSVDDDDDISVSSSVSSSWSEFEQEEENEPTTSSRNWDFHVSGSEYYLDRNGDGDRFSWAGFGAGNSVVKLWENLKLGCDENEIRVFDNNFSSSAPSSKLLFTAEADVAGKMSLNFWDTRVGFQIPALIAEWKPMSGKVIGIDDRKVYVGDVRNVVSPVEKLMTAATVADVETWWDADGDAVMITAE